MISILKIKAMRDRMAERKRRRMKKLEKKQDKEKTEAVRNILCLGFIFH